MPSPHTGSVPDTGACRERHSRPCGPYHYCPSVRPPGVAHRALSQRSRAAVFRVADPPSTAVIPVVALHLSLATVLLGFAALIRPMPALALAPRARGAALVFGGLLLGWAALLVPTDEQRVTRPGSRLDEFLPRYQFGERHVVHVHAPPDVAYRAIQTVTADEIRGFRTLTWIRRFGRDAPESMLNAPDAVPILKVAARTGFAVLAEDPGRELVYGAPGPATPSARARMPQLARTPGGFRALAEPGFAKLAMNFRVSPNGRGGSVVSTETRVLATDPATRRRMAAYWRVIYPGSALIRRSWLAAIRRRAERDAYLSGEPPSAPRR